MKNILLTISTVTLLLAGQSAMALSEDSSGFELITGTTVTYSQPAQELQIPTASYMGQTDSGMEAVDYLKADNTNQ